MLKQEMDSDLTLEVVVSPASKAETQTEMEVEDYAIKAEVRPMGQVEKRSLRTKQKHRKVVLSACIATFLLGLPAALIGSMLASRGSVVYIILFGAIVSFAGLLGIPFAGVSVYAGFAHSSAGEPMPEGMDVFAIGPLLDRISTDVGNSSAIRERLSHLLPLLTTENVAVLETRHYRQLNICLQRVAWEYNSVRGVERALTLAILDAYSRVGDPRAIHHVERIAQGKANTRLRDDEVRAAAHRCTGYLEQAARQLTHHNTLLRSADSATPAGELVRPSISEQDIDPNQLMRPAAETQSHERD